MAEIIFRSGRSCGRLTSRTREEDGEWSSDSDADIEDMNIERMMREFEEEGVTLSNPCDGTKEMMEVELEKWEEYVSCLGDEILT